MMWWTLRFPALIPQVWLNWLSAAPEDEQRALEENPSRVDFVAFWNGERHVIEIDGPFSLRRFRRGDSDVLDQREGVRAEPEDRAVASP
jgi:hypothetical protein